MRSHIAALLLTAMPAVAFAQAPLQAERPTQAPTPAPAPVHSLRNITVRNRAGQAVVEAHATVSNKGDILVTSKGKIEPNEVASFQIDPSQCVQELAARLANGVAVATKGVDNCQLQQFTVFNDHITAD